MAKTTKPQKSYVFKVQVRKSITLETLSIPDAISMSVNHRGDLTLHAYGGTTLAAFNSGCWVSAIREETLKPEQCEST